MIYLDVKQSWIYINNIKTKYYVLSCGLVINSDTLLPMAGGYDKNGYHIVSLTLNKNKYTRKVHRLVAEAFIPNPNNLPEVNHIDGDKRNNDITNLEWVTPEQNSHHACFSNLRYSILTEDDVIEICELLSSGNVRISDIARKFNVSNSHISKILNRRIWKGVSSKYDFSKYTSDKRCYGEKNGNSKLTILDVKYICKYLESGLTPTEISKKLNIPRSIIYRIYHRKCWKDQSSKYKF